MSALAGGAGSVAGCAPSRTVSRSPCYAWAMPEANANDEVRHERRLVDRRLDQVEREVQGLTSGFTKLGAALEAVKVEQGNVKEVLKSRFDALFKEIGRASCRGRG